MAETIQHKELDWDDIHQPFDKSYLDQTARKAASGLESKHLYHLAYQVSDGSGWRITQVTPSVEMVPYTPPEPVVGDIGKSLVVQSDGDSYLKLGWEVVSATPTLDDAYDNDTGERTITVDDGDVSWNLSGAYSFAINLVGATGVATDGFLINNGTNYFRFLRQGPNAIDILSEVRRHTLSASENYYLTVEGTTTMTFEDDVLLTTSSANITLQTTDVAGPNNIILDSIDDVIINADDIDINAIENIYLDASDAISLDAGAASNFTVDGGSDLTLACTGGDPPGDIIINATEIDIDGYTAVNIDASSGNVSIDAVDASNFTVSGASADLTLGARGATVTLNESGETTPDTTAQSLVGAINELNTAIGGLTLDDAYNNDTGTRTIVVDAGDVLWDLDGSYDFVVKASSNDGSTDIFVGRDSDDNDVYRRNSNSKLAIVSGGHVTEHETPTSLADDASYDLPDATAGFCRLIVGDSEEYAFFIWTSGGVVTLIENSANVVTTDTDGEFCIFDNGTSVRIRNRLGATKTLTSDYHYTSSP